MRVCVCEDERERERERERELQGHSDQEDGSSGRHTHTHFLSHTHTCTQTHTPFCMQLWHSVKERPNVNFGQNWLFHALWLRQGCALKHETHRQWCKKEKESCKKE